MLEGARPPLIEPEDAEPGTVRRGWQHEVCSRVERQFREELFAHAPAQVKVLVRSQGGVRATPPSSSSFVRTLVPMWPSNRRCWPSLGCVCTSRGAQSKGFRGGEHPGQDLQGRARASAHQRHGLRHRPSTT